MSELNTADESEDARIERHASWAELFFDLVVVAGVAALAHALGLNLDAAAVGFCALLFLAFWLLVVVDDVHASPPFPTPTATPL